MAKKTKIKPKTLAQPNGRRKEFTVKRANICDDDGTKVLVGEKIMLSAVLAEHYNQLECLVTTITAFDDDAVKKRNDELEAELAELKKGKADAEAAQNPSINPAGHSEANVVRATSDPTGAGTPAPTPSASDPKPAGTPPRRRRGNNDN